MEFSPKNPVVILCIRGMAQEEKSNPEEARRLFLQAWNEATNDFEKFLTTHFLARHQSDGSDRLKWLDTTLEYALKVNDDAVKPAFPDLYANIAKSHEVLGNPDRARENFELSKKYDVLPTDKGPFYHGTRADLKVGDLLTAGNKSNYQADLTMNHIYFTAQIHGAGLAAGLAKGDGRERVYLVEPTGDFQNDPNVTNKKFPGNPTRSYRTSEPLIIKSEVPDWVGLTPEELQKWREKLANSDGDIIN